MAPRLVLAEEIKNLRRVTMAQASTQEKTDQKEVAGKETPGGINPWDKEPPLDVRYYGGVAHGPGARVSRVVPGLTRRRIGDAGCCE